MVISGMVVVKKLLNEQFVVDQGQVANFLVLGFGHALGCTPIVGVCVDDTLLLWYHRRSLILV